MDNSMPAFPSPEFLGDSGLGLTRLETFTMAAMQGLCANSAFGGPVGPAETPEGTLARIAVTIAKAALAELSKHQ